MRPPTAPATAGRLGGRVVRLLTMYHQTEDRAMAYADRMNSALYGPESTFTPDEQESMRRGYTTAERIAISGCVFGLYPQAISQSHADKLDAVNGFHARLCSWCDEPAPHKIGDRDWACDQHAAGYGETCEAASPVNHAVSRAITAHRRGDRPARHWWINAARRAKLQMC